MNCCVGNRFIPSYIHSSRLVLCVAAAFTIASFKLPIVAGTSRYEDDDRLQFRATRTTVS
jgi:hypothetical protein